ncbi:MAG: DUF1599 domain-containing protein [Prevotellaceae bacterium]|nr:DUF1599 domain-containing protein [Prevotellaceae bacterium]
MNTTEEFAAAVAMCRGLFEKKLHDYGTAWRLMRLPSLTDQILIKANRIRTLETTGVAMVDEGIVPEFIGIVNYCLIALIQQELPATATADLTAAEALERYDRHAAASLELMCRKNHDYGEVWRLMRVSSYTDLILMKIFRTKQIEELGGETLVSEDAAANYRDMMNYAVFALIKLVIEKEGEPESR